MVRTFIVNLFILLHYYHLAMAHFTHQWIGHGYFFHLFESGSLLDEFLAGISFLLESLDLVDIHAEDEDVLLAHFLCHLNIGSVQSSDCQSAVQLQHVSILKF